LAEADVRRQDLQIKELPARTKRPVMQELVNRTHRYEPIDRRQGHWLSLPNDRQFKLIRAAAAKQWAPLRMPFAWYP
jgi:hypothetical protein